MEDDFSGYEQSVIDMAVEGWRFSRLFSRVISKLDAGEANQLRYFQKRIEENLERLDMKLVNVEGQVFDQGMAATALNIADFSAEDMLIINQMIEPIIMGPEGLKRQGTVMVGKVNL
jgi:hypothetical protein